MSDPITLEEVNKVVKCAKSGKAAGYDGCSMKCIKMSHHSKCCEYYFICVPNAVLYLLHGKGQL